MSHTTIWCKIDVHGSDFVPVEGGEGKENEGVEEEGDGGCYDIIDWKNNKHISEGDFSMSKVGDLNGSAPRWVPLITVCSQTAQGISVMTFLFWFWSENVSQLSQGRYKKSL